MPVPSLGFIAGPGLTPAENDLAKKKVHGWNRARKLKVFALGAERVGESLRRFPKPMWSFTPGKAKWRIGEVLWHLADQEANLYVRLRRAAAEPGSPVSPYDQDKWSSRLSYAKADFDQAWALLRLLRKANTDLLKRLPAPAWKAKVKHPEWGMLSIEYLVGQNIWHIEHHIGQMAKRYREWKEKRN